MKNKNGCNHTQTMTATLFRHLDEQGYNSMITTGNFKSCTLFVALFESFVERVPLLKHPCDGLFFFFYLSSKRKRKAVTQRGGQRQSTSIYHHSSKILRQCMGNGASELVNSGSKLAFTSEVVL